jgi:two-component system, NtrC family, sensor kinase
VPLMREGSAIGTISVRRRQVQLFTERQRALLKTFADQAVIAIENVRLFKELEAKNNDLTATSEILRVISASPTDVQPVFETIVRNASMVCGAFDAAIFIRDGDQIYLAAHQGPIQAHTIGTPFALSVATVAGRAILNARPMHVDDLSTAVDYPEGRVYAGQFGYRTTLAVPLVARDAAAVGALLIRRNEVRPFSDQQIALLTTFADQAVIAIENVRLFTELQERNLDLRESLDRQTATADVLRIIAESPTDLQPVLEAIAASAVRLCAASDAVIERLEGDRFYNAAHSGAQMKGLVGLPLPLTRRFPGGRAVLDRAPVIIDDIHLIAEREYPDTLELLKLNTIHSVAEIPLLSEGKALGSIAVLRAEVRPFTEAEVALLQTFADQAVIAIENVRLFKELQTSNRDLTEALEQRTATSEILRVISSSPTNVQPVFDTIVHSAVQLCDAVMSNVQLFDGELLHWVAQQNVPQETMDSFRRLYPMRPDRRQIAGRAVLDRTLVHLPDVLADPEYQREMALKGGWRSVLSVPMMRAGDPIGALTVARLEPFSDTQIALLRTFADQAVIAIENVRLFKELGSANRDLAAASQHKSEFLANMSHELRTPLNAIIGFSEVLSDRMFGELNEKQEEYLKDIHASGTHLLSLINDILDLSKIEAGRMELELTDFHLPTTLDNALMLVRERAGRRSIALNTTIDNRLGQIQGDERKIRQVVLNLLSNAIKFTPEGGGIEIAAIPKDGCVEVSISDTGVGIAPEDQEKVFEEFRQVGTAEKKAEGTGLGLTLCRKFIELHGGRIWVKSQIGVGSTFTFTIPVRRGE